MQRLSFRLQCLVIGWSLLQPSVLLQADSCVKFHKRAPVKAVCGRVTNPLGEKLSDVELTVTGETDSVLFTTKSDSAGSFRFRLVPKGDYTLHVEPRLGYIGIQREIRVTKSNEEKYSRKIDITLGTSSCTTGTEVKGVDKPSDLDSKTP
ncbi:MAG: carboxypeptidase-like regulatory domain-containing protein [Candidatus Sulfotelmatobacter sp.]